MQNQEKAIGESSVWQSAHYQEPYYSKRTAKLLPKLARLGILALPLETRILDACCGRGEALETLQKAGFRNLVGIDATPPPDYKPGGPLLRCGDVQHMPFPDSSFDVILNLHALHHMGGAEGVARFLSECHRILQPNGMLAIIDFPRNARIRLLFWLLRKRFFRVTGNLRNFATIVDEEWSYLEPYLRSWPEVKRVLDRAPFTTIRSCQRFFLYYRTVRRA